MCRSPAPTARSRHHPPIRLLQWAPPTATLDPCPATDEEISPYVTALEGVRRTWDAQARRAAEAQWADDVAALRELAGTLRWGSVLCVMAEQRLYRRLDRWTDVFARVMMPVAEDLARRVAAGAGNDS